MKSAIAAAEAPMAIASFGTNGGYVVVWQQLVGTDIFTVAWTGHDQDFYGILARRYAASCVAAG